MTPGSAPESQGSGKRSGPSGVTTRLSPWRSVPGTHSFGYPWPPGANRRWRPSIGRRFGPSVPWSGGTLGPNPFALLSETAVCVSRREPNRRSVRCLHNWGFRGAQGATESGRPGVSSGHRDRGPRRRSIPAVQIGATRSGDKRSRTVTHVTYAAPAPLIRPPRTPTGADVEDPQNWWKGGK
jgi:hypothetical protein